jgi:malate synthase
MIVRIRSEGELLVNVPEGVEIVGEVPEGLAWVLDADALALAARLQRELGPRRRELLEARAARQAELDAGGTLDFLPETAAIRDGDWRVPPAPADLQDRRVEITGPAEPKMMINALNSGARVFMCDLEDALSPTWRNVIDGQRALHDAIRRTLEFTSPEGKHYELGDDLATLIVRPRGWHLDERHVLVDGEPIAGGLFDMALYVHHNARELLERGSGPYLYLPKLESHREAALWNDAFEIAQDAVGVPRGSIRATVLIETLPAAFEMEEILHALGPHATGLNAGRWDYIFSAIKKLRTHRDAVLPDRANVTMAVPFMRAYTQNLVRACHRRGAHAIGGMAAFIPSRRDAAVNEMAFTKVREDKEREVNGGCDGTWVAHPDLVPLAMGIFDGVLGDAPNQVERLREDVVPDAGSLLALGETPGAITEQGVRTNISVGTRYIAAWLDGLGAVAIDNLMEDAATAEISRAQLWQWIHFGVELDDGRPVTRDLYEALRDEEIAKIGGRDEGRIGEAVDLLDQLVLQERFEEFLTIPAYQRLG